MSSQEKRVGVRVDGQFYVRVIGVDEVAALRAGNISVSGIFFTTDRPVGDVGAVERIEVRTADGAVSFVVTAAVVRVDTTKDIWEGERVMGAAFRFLAPGQAVRDAIAKLVRRVADDNLAGGSAVPTPALTATVSGSGETTVESVRSQGMVLLTAWPVEEGADITITIDEHTAGVPVEVRGQVRRRHVLEPGARFRIDVEVAGRVQKLTGPPADDLEGAMDALLGALVDPQRPLPEMKGDHALAGSLERVPLTSLLSFMEWEEWTGQLVLDHGEGRATIFVRLGQPLDVEASWDQNDPREVLRAVIGWKKGTFSLASRAVDHEDRFQQPLRALLMDLARESDEETR